MTATNTLTGKKYATTTDVDGVYQMAVPRNGRYVVKTELTGFASVTQEVVVNASSENGGLPMQTAEFKMDLASRVAPDTAATVATTAARQRLAREPSRAGPQLPRRRSRAPAPSRAKAARTQTLTVQGNEDADTDRRNRGRQATPRRSCPRWAAWLGDDTSALANDSIAVNGHQGQINGLAGFSQDDLRNRIQDMQRQGLGNGDIAGALQGVMQAGTFGGPGGGPGGGGGSADPAAAALVAVDRWRWRRWRWRRWRRRSVARGGGGGGGGFGGFGGFRGQNPNAWHGTSPTTDRTAR